MTYKPGMNRDQMLAIAPASRPIPTSEISHLTAVRFSRGATVMSDQTLLWSAIVPTGDPRSSTKRSVFARARFDRRSSRANARTGSAAATTKSKLNHDRISMLRTLSVEAHSKSQSGGPSSIESHGTLLDHAVGLSELDAQFRPDDLDAANKRVGHTPTHIGDHYSICINI